MDNSLDNFLRGEFFGSFSSKLFGLGEFFEPFLDSNNHLFIDARKFPNMNVVLMHPSEVSQIIPKESFKHYASCSTTYEEGLVIFLSSECDVLFYCIESKTDEKLERIYESQEDSKFYLKAYENGLLKEAYSQAKGSEQPIIFCIKDGVASLLTLELAEKEINDYLLGHPEKEASDTIADWILLANDPEINPYLVSILYIDQKSNNFWYDVLSIDYEMELFDKWGWEY